MTVALRSLEVAVPDIALAQDDVRDVFAAQPGPGRLGTRLVSAAFNASGVDRRHTVLGEWGSAGPAGDPVFFDARTLRILNPSTGTRNRVCAQEATGLCIRAAARALAAYKAVEAADITHVITASCTGFYAPGPTVESALMTRIGATGAPVPAAGDRAALGDVPEALNAGSGAGR